MNDKLKEAFRLGYNSSDYESIFCRNPKALELIANNSVGNPENIKIIDMFNKGVDTRRVSSSGDF